jgi:hypothetical protein
MSVIVAASCRTRKTWRRPQLRERLDPRTVAVHPGERTRPRVQRSAPPPTASSLATPPAAPSIGQKFAQRPFPCRGFFP